MNKTPCAIPCKNAETTCGVSPNIWIHTWFLT